jgi:hypothetical protein
MGQARTLGAVASIREFRSWRRAGSLALLTVLALAGCGGTNAQRARSSRVTSIVGINLNAAAPPRDAAVDNGIPNVVVVAALAPLRGPARTAFQLGETVVGESGCLGCHLIGAVGNNGPGPPLTHIGARLSRVGIIRQLLNPAAPMPSFAGLPKSRLHALTAFLADLR